MKHCERWRGFPNGCSFGTPTFKVHVWILTSKTKGLFGLDEEWKRKNNGSGENNPHRSVLDYIVFLRFDFCSRIILCKDRPVLIVVCKWLVLVLLWGSYILVVLVVAWGGREVMSLSRGIYGSCFTTDLSYICRLSCIPCLFKEEWRICLIKELKPKPPMVRGRSVSLRPSFSHQTLRRA